MEFKMKILLLLHRNSWINHLIIYGKWTFCLNEWMDWNICVLCCAVQCFVSCDFIWLLTISAFRTVTHIKGSHILKNFYIFWWLLGLTFWGWMFRVHLSVNFFCLKLLSVWSIMCIVLGWIYCLRTNEAPYIHEISTLFKNLYFNEVNLIPLDLVDDIPSIHISNILKHITKLKVIDGNTTIHVWGQRPVFYAPSFSNRSGYSLKVKIDNKW